MEVQELINQTVFVLFIIFTCAIPLSIVSMRFREGFWGNTICVCNISFASLLALNYFEPLAGILASLWINGLFFYDFAAYWLIFSLCYLIFDSVTRQLSHIKVHFPKYVEMIGNGLAMLMIFSYFSAAILFSYPTAPLKPSEDAVAKEAPFTETLGRRARILSMGPLSSFLGTREWTASEDYVGDHVAKRWLVYNQAMKDHTFMYSGVMPATKKKE